MQGVFKEFTKKASQSIDLTSFRVFSIWSFQRESTRVVSKKSTGLFLLVAFRFALSTPTPFRLSFCSIKNVSFAFAHDTFFGASNGSRTRDLVLTKDALCQLSYGSTKLCITSKNLILFHHLLCVFQLFFLFFGLHYLLL